MLSEILNPLSIILSLTAMFSVFIHDTQIDGAVKATMLSSAVVSDIPAVGSIKLLSIDQHIHAESSFFHGLNSQQPVTQARDKDDKKYIAVKRLVGDSFGSEYSWPFI